MKYSVKEEKELMSAIWSLNVKDDPYNFVKIVFPWGQKDTPLDNFSGPRSGKKILREFQYISKETVSLIYQKCLDWP